MVEKKKSNFCLIFLFFFFCVFVFGNFVLAQTAYKKELVFKVPFNKENPIHRFAVNEDGYFFLLHIKKPLVEICDKTGKLVRSFEWEKKANNRNYFIKADKDGSVLICPAFSSKENACVYSNNGAEKDSFNVDKPIYGQGEIVFKDGSLYSFKSGECLHGIANQDTIDKKTLKNFGIHWPSSQKPTSVLAETAQGPIKFKKQIDRFLFYDILAVDSIGEYYCTYLSQDIKIGSDGSKIRLSTYRIYVFDSRTNLTGVLKEDINIDPSLFFVVRDGDVFEENISDDNKYLGFYKWKRP